MMQSYGFALPISLVIPGSIAAITAISAMRAKYTCALHRLFPDYLFFDVPHDIGDVAAFLNHWYPWIWLLSLSSQAWITMHIWLPHIEKLAPTGHIFLVPTYDSLVIDQSIVLNRRIDDISDDIPNIERLDGSDTTYSNLSIKSGLSEIEENDRVTRILVCATMWHETEDEMMEFVGSILRLDTDQATKRFTQGYYNLRMQDYYELETHVFFDDAFRCMHGCEGRCDHDENETQVNDYAMSLIKTMEKSIEKFPVVSKPPKKYPCPYGGRLEWNLPGKTRMIVHLKDKNKIRHRKRWSQVMYMYYLLGHLFMDTPISRGRKKVIAENTFLLTLDGDIDFQPSAVKVLVDLMKRDKDVGAACGRIHPVGTGPMVWFQKFEYAISHWLLKSTEHAIGSVLCSPGAFSLFRAKALMEHNVMRKYATQSTAPMHYVQYDQGEDRWLCTLLLQAGYRIEYSAVSDSYTHAPETFNEFYNQRRRWIPSTMANIYDLLSTSQETRKINDDISWLYIVYQWILMGSTILGPGTIFLMLVGAFVAAFRIDNGSSFGYNLIPIVIFVIVCTFCTARIQLIVAGMITALYGLVMIVVLVGIMLQIAEDGWAAPSTILFFVVAGQLVVAGLIHPQEWSCLLCGLIYYITVPSMYMVLIIFALFNVNNVTWGTRDSKTVVPQENEKNDVPERGQSVKSRIGSKFRTDSNQNRGSIEFSLAGLFRCILCTHNGVSEEDRKLEVIKYSLDQITSRLDAMERNTHDNETQKNRQGEPYLGSIESSASQPIARSNSANYAAEYNAAVEKEGDDDDEDISETATDIYGEGSSRGGADFLVSPCWIQDENLRKGGVEFLSSEEEIFWEGLIEKYLHPIEEDKKIIEQTAEGLKNLRDGNVFKFFMINALFVLIIFLMQLKKDVLHLEWPLGKTYNISYSQYTNEVFIYKNYLELEPIGCLFILGFVMILTVQFIAMLVHRFQTFSHILANTSIEWPCCKKPFDPTDEEDLEKHADDIADGLQKIVENTGGSVLAKRNSTVAPSKRPTVQELLDSSERKVKLSTSLDTLFRRNLNDSNSEMSRFMSTRMQPDIVEALERRHSSMVSHQKHSRVHNNHNENDTNNISAKKSHNNSITRTNGCSYDNKAFVSESDN
ncbi:chitin synthase chs-2-like [Venturia canescens]|uniref:chitin synthase chs-2-like n=1 Tax=Venturia canescens TaxID=32260 RepID=UPI001C9CD559|nr:chitin synthase chs-2-like [Venturia canescens]